jgi:hypothetical protein
LQNHAVDLALSLMGEVHSFNRPLSDLDEAKELLKALKGNAQAEPMLRFIEKMREEKNAVQ